MTSNRPPAFLRPLLLAGFLAAGATGAPAAMAAAVTLRIPASAEHRAVFCGAEGTETSAVYARALLHDLRVLESTGLHTQAAVAALQAQACAGQRTYWSTKSAPSPTSR